MPVLNSTSAPYFRRAGDDPIPPAQKKFNATGISVNQVRAKLKIGAPLPLAHHHVGASVVFAVTFPPHTPLPWTAFSVFEKMKENDRKLKK
jgi:hypothetical protein